MNKRIWLMVIVVLSVGVLLGYGRVVLAGNPQADVEYSGTGGMKQEAGREYLATTESGLAGTLLLSETFKLLSPNPIVDGRYGRTVLVDGDTLFVGQTQGDINNIPGQVYIYERHFGGPNNWGLTKILTPSDSTAWDGFGHSLSIAGDTLLVGAGLANGNVNQSGAVYIYERNAGGPDNWGEVAKLIAPDGANNDRFGWTADIDGDTAVVGARWHASGGVNRGAAYIYGRNTGGPDNWGLIKKITASNPANFDRFGWAVAIDGDTVVIGADLKDANGTDSGLAYIFERNLGGPDNWGEVIQIAPDMPLSNDWFGESVAIEGDLVAVGAVERDTPRPGAVYLFDRNTGGSNSWGQIAKLTASDGNAGDRLGFSLSLRGDTLLVGGQYSDGMVNNSGAVYIFRQDAGNPNQWYEAAKLIASDGAANDEFGRDVDFFGETIAVGALRDDDHCPANPNCDSGSAYIYTTILPADVAIEKTVSNNTAVPGQPLTYTLTFSNNGPGIAFGTIITDLIPNTLINPAFTSSGVIITPTGSAPFVWQVANMTPGEGGIITVTGIISPELMSETVIVNTAVISNSLDITPTNNMDTVVTRVLLPQISLNSTNYVVDEDAGMVTVTAVLSPAQPFLDVTVEYQTMDGTALAGEDYTAVSGILTFTAGSTLVNLTIPILDDQLVEPAETFTLTLSSPAYANLGAITTAIVTIEDDDALPEASLSASSYAVPEDVGNAVITMTLNQPYPQPVAVSYQTADGTATAPEDYTAVSHTITFTAGITQATLVVPIIDDALIEADETFTLTLIGFVNATPLPPVSATVTILDNDAVPAPTDTHLYLPFVTRPTEAPPPSAFPIFISDGVAPRPVVVQGEVFFTATIQIPANLPSSGQFFLSSSSTQISPIAVDDELAFILDGQEVFVKRFSFDGQTIHPEIVEIPGHIMESMAGESVTILFRDVFGDRVSATAVWLIVTP